MFRWRRRPKADDLPEAHQIVLRILVERGSLTWEELVVEAAKVGIGEAELHEVMHGAPPPE